MAVVRAVASGSCLFRLLVERPVGDSAFVLVSPDLTAYSLTCGELRVDAERFSVFLRERGVGPGQAVAVLLDHSRELLALMLGIWHRGAVAVPLFTELGPEAVAHRLGRSGAELVFTSVEQSSKAAGVPGVEVVVVDGDGAMGADVFAARGDVGEPASYAPDAAIACLFTSGTTGVPKGVPVTMAMTDVFRAGLSCCADARPNDLLWVQSPPAWGYFVFFGLLAALLEGVPSLVLCGAAPSPALVRDVLHAHPVTNFASVPTMYRALRDEAPPDPMRHMVRRCLSSGEPLPEPVREWCEEVLGPVSDALGQTETGGWFLANADSSALVAAGQTQRPQPRSAMAVLPGFDVRVLELETADPAPAGVAGRIALRVPTSPLMAFPGYLDDPEQTAVRYPHGPEWYVTGDAGVLGDGGLITPLGRADDLIISRGFNVAPAEMEAVLLRHPAVAEAAAVGVPDDRHGQALVLQAVPAAGVGGEVEGLSAELKAFVEADYGDPVPIREVRIVAELPRTVTGKIRRMLLEP
ncbi:AMP-binding protein [Streptomyces sp. NPDC006385]|uniref:AMP-binding protein n=1 Tax=Streptomyces sp. NPDC006385 TaxID=3156761 RepID=UPI0033B1A64D